MKSETFDKFVNSLKGMCCGVLVWALVLWVLRIIRSVDIFRPLYRPLRILLMSFGPTALYPFVLWAVLHYQLPSLSTRYIKKHWPLWIPGLMVACLPSIDYLFLGRRLIRLITG
ncbi:MAG: hypothetical protein ACO3N7_10585 [Kiritimatiellia bacterium]